MRRRSELMASDRVRRIKASAVFCAAALAVLYVASYAVLSRAGFRRADANNVEGFYFCDPTSSGRNSTEFLSICMARCYYLIDGAERASLPRIRR